MIYVDLPYTYQSIDSHLDLCMCSNVFSRPRICNRNVEYFLLSLVNYKQWKQLSWCCRWKFPEYTFTYIKTPSSGSRLVSKHELVNNDCSSNLERLLIWRIINFVIKMAGICKIYLIASASVTNPFPSPLRNVVVVKNIAIQIPL